MLICDAKMSTEVVFISTVVGNAFQVHFTMLAMENFEIKIMVNPRILISQRSMNPVTNYTYACTTRCKQQDFRILVLQNTQQCSRVVRPPDLK